VFTRGSDIREYRLLLLMKHVLDGAVPDDDYVSALFQTNSGQSRGLIRAVLSKFQYQVETGVHDTVRRVVDEARREGDNTVWTVIIHSGNVVDALNREIEILSGALPLVTRTPRTAARYEINRSTYLRLCEALAEAQTRILSLKSGKGAANVRPWRGSFVGSFFGFHDLSRSR
jgi:hypothetical protein